TGKVNIPPARPQPVPTGKPKVPAPVPTGRQNWPFPVPTDRGYSPSENPYSDAEDEGIFDSGCSRRMTCNMEILDDFQEFQGGKVTFGGGKGRITGKGTIKTPTLDFENVYYDFMLQMERWWYLGCQGNTNLYTINLNNLSPRGNLACLLVKASVDESVKWHMRMGHAKQHKASYKAITAVSSISEPLQLLHMDLFGPTSIRSIDHKY
ncbi:hypothetical protein Tco_0431879, partial [Tanacetum coccineum]